MTYKQTIEYLYNSTPVFERVGASAYKEGLYNTIALDNYFGNPHRSYKTVHIAGTNGKGSVSHTIAAVLQSAGMKVGLYTSPHLVDFRERIRVNGVPISKEYVVDFVNRSKDFFEPLHPSFFELTTAMAFKYFEGEGVDIAVIEVGLGGRLDCTNIIQPVLSVITNISYDHTGFLGSTLEQIAGEKAGIIKPHTPVVIGEYLAETRPVFERKAFEMQASVVFAQDGEDNLDIPYFQLDGAYQGRNAVTVMTACKELMRLGIIPYQVIDASGQKKNPVVEGFAHVCDITGLRGRWEKIRDTPLVICDTGHNMAGWEYIAPQIVRIHQERSRDKGGSSLRIVFGMVDDKDIRGVLSLLPHYAEYYFCQATTHRAIPAESVSRIASGFGLQGKSFLSVEEAYTKAVADSSDSDFIFVGGSSYVVADFLTFLAR